jgi:hypothetical protein
MRTALAIFCLILFVPGLSHGQTFGLGGLAESRPVRAQVFGLGEVATVKPRLQVQPVATVQEIRTVQPVATNKESSLVRPVATVQEIRAVQPQTICIDGKCYPATQSRQVIQRQPLFRRWR